MKVKTEGRLGVGLLQDCRAVNIMGMSKELRVHLGWDGHWDQITMALQAKELAG